VGAAYLAQVAYNEKQSENIGIQKKSTDNNDKFTWRNQIIIASLAAVAIAGIIFTRKHR
jgi:hypothetical protein